MFEVYYRSPRDTEKEQRLTDQVTSLGGGFDFREESAIADVCNQICLTYEFDDLGRAEAVADLLRQQGEHVEGPAPYGN